MEVTQIPGRTGQHTAGRACAAGLGDSVWGVNLNWDEGGGSDPPEVAWSEGNVHQGGNREGWAGPSCLGLSPSLPQPQACNTVWLQPWGWGDVPDGSVLGIGAHPRGTPPDLP